jgi:Spy/CpxP family protein refolding chaperone
MNMKKIAIIGGILILVAAVSIPLLGTDPAEGRGKGNWVGPRYGEYGCYGQPLNLNTEQTEKFNAMREEHFKEMAPLRNELSKKRAELRDLRSNPGTDNAALQAKEAEVSQLEKRLLEKRAQFRAEYNKNLTPEQLSQQKWNQQRRGFGRYGKYGRGGCGWGRF